MSVELDIGRILKTYKTATLIFEALIKNPEIDGWLKAAATLCRKEMINRHDKLHALQVTNYSLEMFKILRDSKCLRPIVVGNALMDPLEDSLVIILISSYCHDIARVLGKHSENLIPILIELLKEAGIPTPLQDNLMPLILRSAQDHGGDSKASFQEEGILMVADGADCDRNRVQPGFRDVDVLRDGLSNGRSPIHYFSCKGVRDVKITRSHNASRPILFVFTIGSGAAAFQLEDFMKRLRNSNLEKLVEVRVQWRKSRLNVWPS